MFQLRNVSLWPIMVSFLCYTLKCVLNKLRKIKNKIMHKSIQNSLKTIFYIVGEVSFIFFFTSVHECCAFTTTAVIRCVCDRSSAEVWHSNKCSEKSVSRRCTERLRQRKVRILMSVILIQYVEFRCLCPDGLVQTQVHVWKTCSWTREYNISLLWSWYWSIRVQR